MCGVAAGMHSDEHLGGNARKSFNPLSEPDQQLAVGQAVCKKALYNSVQICKDRKIPAQNLKSHMPEHEGNKLKVLKHV